MPSTPDGTVPPEEAAQPSQPFADPIPGVIPFGAVCVLGGAAGAGKTTLLKDWIRRWQAGQTICGRQTNCPTKFYFLSADRQQDNLIAELPGVEMYALAHDLDFNQAILGNSSSALDVFTGCIARLKPQPGGFLIVDPITPLLIPGTINDPRAVARSLLFLSRTTRALQITSLATAHFHKQPSDTSQKYRRPQDRIAGSGAFSGFSDTQMYLIDPEPPEQPYHIFGWNPRRQAPQTFNFTREPDGFVPYRSLEDVGTVGAAAEPPPSEDAAMLLQLLPPDGAMTGALEGAALAQLQISRATYFRLLKQLEDLGIISRPYGWIKWAKGKQTAN